LLSRSVKIRETFECWDMCDVNAVNGRLEVNGQYILCVVLILTPYNIEKVHAKFVPAC